MVTAVGQDLKDYDKDMSGAANFYRQLFGRWPDDEPEDSVIKILGNCVRIVPNGSFVATYFGLGCKRQALTDQQMKNVEVGLEEIRMSMEFRELVLLFYKDYNATLEILEHVVTLWAKTNDKRLLAEAKCRGREGELDVLRAKQGRQQAYREGMKNRLEGVADYLCQEVRVKFEGLQEDVVKEV